MAKPGPAQSTLGKLLSFAVAGGTGFIVDVSVLRLGIEFFGLTPFVARIPAIAAAMATTWLINRTFTFGASGRKLRDEGSRYIAVALIGAILNYIVYSAILLALPNGFGPITDDFLLPEFATFTAVAIVTVFSYLGYSRFVFGNK